MKHENFVTLTTKELLQTVDTDSSVGLSSSEAKQRLFKYGNNSLVIHDKYLWLKNLLYRFQNPLVIVLLAVSIISLFVDDVQSFFVISIILIISIALDYYQERNAVIEIESLKRTQAQIAVVVKGRIEHEFLA